MKGKGVTAGGKRIAVVGAGIVGACCAVHLQEDGHEVVLVDRLAPGEACSFGNAGLLATSSFVPLAMPGVLGQVPKWLLDPLAPFALRFAYAPRLLGFLWRFIRAGAPERVEAAADALATLTTPTVESYRRLADLAGVPDLVRAADYMYVYETESAYAKDARPWALRRARGIDFAELTPAEVLEREPALAPIHVRGVLVRGHGYTIDPSRLVKALADLVGRQGGAVLRREVRDIAYDAGGAPRLVTDAGEIQADALVIAAGAWSSRLTALLGHPVPLEAERGYHVTVRDAGVRLNAPLMIGGHKFAVTPMEMGLRFAGTSEWAGLDAEPNYRRARVFLTHARRMFPGIRLDHVTEWMGPRPTLPDSLPVIGRSPRHPAVFFAFGHQHIGLTAGAKTGRIVADLVAGRTPNLELRPFRIDRF
jgi:D-amino-acid dehydrogenase